MRIKSFIQHSALFSFCFLLLLSQSLHATEKYAFNAGHLQSINTAKTFTLKAENIEQNYHIYVQLPDSIKEGKKFPTVYLLDGGGTFPMLAPYYKLLKFLNDVPEVIIVGISYGTDDWRKGNARGRDFTLPAKSREHWGGAPDFSHFLKNQLFHKIETEFPSDPSKRVLFGNSLGGQFGLYNATFNPGLFYGIISNNPALHRNVESFLDVKALEHSKASTRLFVADAEFDGERFKKPRARWIERWEKKPLAGWQLKIQPMPGHNHFSSIPDSFRMGLKWILQ